MATHDQPAREFDSWTPHPLMFGYLRVDQLARGVTTEVMREQLVAFADRTGYALVGVFVDQDHTVPTTLNALIDAVKKYDARAVAVPTLDHLAAHGSRPLVGVVQNATGAQVLALNGDSG